MHFYLKNINYHRYIIDLIFLTERCNIIGGMNYLMIISMIKFSIFNILNFHIIDIYCSHIKFKLVYFKFIRIKFSFFFEIILFNILLPYKSGFLFILFLYFNYTNYPNFLIYRERPSSFSYIFFLKVILL